MFFQFTILFINWTTINYLLTSHVPSTIFLKNKQATQEFCSLEEIMLLSSQFLSCEHDSCKIFSCYTTMSWKTIHKWINFCKIVQEPCLIRATRPRFVSTMELDDWRMFANVAYKKSFWFLQKIVCHRMQGCKSFVPITLICKTSARLNFSLVLHRSLTLV